jgi:hypothetical protein
MSLRAMKVMVTRAVTSDQFRKGMMNGRRAELIREYDLDPDERVEIMAIQANTESEFYRAMDRIMLSRASRRSTLLADPSAGTDHSLKVTARYAGARLTASVWR